MDNEETGLYLITLEATDCTPDQHGIVGILDEVLSKNTIRTLT